MIGGGGGGGILGGGGGGGGTCFKGFISRGTGGGGGAGTFLTTGGGGGGGGGIFFDCEKVAKESSIAKIDRLHLRSFIIIFFTMTRYNSDSIKKPCDAQGLSSWFR